ncbi:MAG: aspartate dehydrogenase [Lachnospiraceae bacterium]|nr:aspartate dehydrogenase [Lachnospiraceae bacterium]
MGLFSKKKAIVPEYTFDPENEKAIIRASICNGEQVAGFKNIKTGEFHEVMLIRSDEDLQNFKRIYGVDKVEKVY